jgi:hypothetical protein
VTAEKSPILDLIVLIAGVVASAGAMRVILVMVLSSLLAWRGKSAGPLMAVDGPAPLVIGQL